MVVSCLLQRVLTRELVKDRNLMLIISSSNLTLSPVLSLKPYVDAVLNRFIQYVSLDMRFV